MAFVVPVLLLGVPILDTSTAIVRRALSERALFAPDKKHIHHQLVQQGSEKSAVLILYLVGAWFGSAAILTAVLPTTWGYAMAGMTAVLAFVWSWRIGSLAPVSREPEPEGNELPVPELLAMDNGTGSKNGGTSLSSREVNGVREGASVG
jgi:UDP-GlcNAc:undecaprenyl-phosphate GlcNAc-1-phosphate transferase